jgi:predicted O-methyltransferase YrrM
MLQKFIRKIYYNPGLLLSKIYVKIMRDSILKKRPPYGDVKRAVEFVFTYRNFLSRLYWRVSPEYAPFTIIPAQIPEEISGLLTLLQQLKPKNILEIGTERGGTLFLYTYVAAEDAKIISIDLPPGQYQFGFSYPQWKEAVYRSFGFYSQKIYLIRGSSHDRETLKQVIKILSNEPLDFLFIDGDHSYEGVRKDFEMYSPLVRKGGIIAFHDIVLGPPENVGGVPKIFGTK